MNITFFERGIYVENLNSISNIMNLVKLFAPSSTPSPTSVSGEKSWPMFPLDAQIHTESLRVCKCLIPYLPFEKQRDLSILIKVFELVSISNHFSNLDVASTTHLDLNRGENWQSDLLLSVKNNLDPKNAYWVDIFFKINDVKKILASAQSSPPPTEKVAKIENNNNPKPSQDFMNNIAPSLDDNQKRILEMLSTVMK